MPIKSKYEAYGSYKTLPILQSQETNQGFERKWLLCPKRGQPRVLYQCRLQHRTQNHWARIWNFLVPSLLHNRDVWDDPLGIACSSTYTWSLVASMKLGYLGYFGNRCYPCTNFHWHNLCNGKLSVFDCADYPTHSKWSSGLQVPGIRIIVVAWIWLC